jgi:hypothetical protein
MNDKTAVLMAKPAGESSPDPRLDSAASRQDAGPSFVEGFSRDVAPGKVIGSSTAEGIFRRGVDRESVISVDGGALRIEPLIRPGWGRSGIAYGPFQRRPGLAFHTLVLNGHNISRTDVLPDRFRGRLKRWLIGPEVEPRRRRIVQWLRSGNKRHMWRRVRQWFRSGARLLHWPLIDENLAVGWFPVEAPLDPLRQGCGLAVHAIIPEGGELWAHVGAHSLPTIRGLQNIPIYYTVVLREEGAAYYASSPTDLPGLPKFPQLRLLAIDPSNRDASVYAGIHQSALGEIGFRADTRVFGTQVTKIPALGRWYGSAHGADSMRGDGPLAATGAEIGGIWSVAEGQFQRTERGSVGQDAVNTALLTLPAPSGLIHALIDCGAEPVEGVAVIWRAIDEQNFWCFEIGSDYAQLAILEQGHWHRHARVPGRHLPPNATSSVQVYDDGSTIRVSVNGKLAYGSKLHDTRLQSAAGVGVRIAGNGGDVAVRMFEAHPREIRVPDLVSLGGPKFTFGDRILAEDDFDGQPGDLAGHRTQVGDLKWERGIGSGILALTGGKSVRVKGSPEEPCPGRTAYMVPWPDARFADVQVTVSPPDKIEGSFENRGRAGVIFWQDPENYLILSAFVEDYPAMSMAAFFQMDGFEELYDAVWSNVGSRMHWGERHELRATFDGQEFATYINGEPVLCRSLADVYPRCKLFEVNRVGLVSNWEWGNDTGSRFERFIGRTRR